MKTTGALTLTVGVALALVLAVWPVRITVLGTTVSCGPPAVAIADDSAGDIESICHQESAQRMLVSLVVLSVSLIGGVMMVGNAPTEPARPTYGASPAPGWMPPPTYPRVPQPPPGWPPQQQPPWQR